MAANGYMRSDADDEETSIVDDDDAGAPTMLGVLICKTLLYLFSLKPRFLMSLTTSVFIVK